MRSEDPAFLYVDDDQLSRDVLQVLLEKVMGYEQVTYFADSKRFMERVRALPQIPTLIFLDILVQPYDGYEMLAMLHADPNYADTRIVALTANVMATDITKLQEAGFDGLIGKPINNRIFPELVRQILDGESIWYIS